jgi:general secretion pathway protein K
MALVLVLWLVVFLSVLATGHARNAHAEAQLTSMYIGTAKARALAEAGANLAILDLLLPSVSRQWPVDGTVRSVELDGNDLTIAIRDATGLVDLNVASPALFSTLIQAANVDDATAQEIVDAILDWRDADDLTHLNGAEDDAYRASGLAWSARDGEFTSVEELLYVKGMTRSIFDTVAPYLTVYSGSSSVDLEYAPPALVSMLTGQEIEATDAHREPDAAGNGTFRIYVSASASKRATFSLETVVRLGPDPELPYVVLYWREAVNALVPKPEGIET